MSPLRFSDKRPLFSLPPPLPPPLCPPLFTHANFQAFGEGEEEEGAQISFMPLLSNTPTRFFFLCRGFLFAKIGNEWSYKKIFKYIFVRKFPEGSGCCVLPSLSFPSSRDIACKNLLIRATRDFFLIVFPFLLPFVFRTVYVSPAETSFTLGNKNVFSTKRVGNRSTLFSTFRFPIFARLSHRKKSS